MQGVESIPSWLADYLDITTASAQTLLSVIVIIAVLLPVFYLASTTKAKTNHTAIYLLLIVLTSAFLVGIQWLPFWLLVAEVSIFAMTYAFLGSKAIAG